MEKPLLRHFSYGTGKKTLVFLHGFAGFGLLWRYQTDHIEGDLCGLTFDLPGHGQSEWHNESLSDMAEALYLALASQGVEKFIIVASSFGGLVALTFLEKYPAMVEKIIFAGSLPRFTADIDYPAGLNAEKINKLAKQLEGDLQGTLDMFFRSLFTREERESPAFSSIQQLYRLGVTPRKEALLAYLEILKTADLRNVYKTVSVPVLVIVGDGDYIFPMSLVKRVKAVMPSLRIDVIKGCGHFPFLSYPSVFNKLMKDFIQDAS